MTRFTGAVIREQGLTFGIALVKPGVLARANDREEIVARMSMAFGGIPTILASQSGHRLRYYGRQDIVRFMSRVPTAAVPWKEYTLS